ncbi:PLD nuclease N-terminal domain-containing protein [Paenibacillus graminis]|uniref:Negative regulatory protein YxlE n=1 Tax=Paenibacillus graminis TaxID=189425 RepID=A0A089MB40_9BACL|nr:PLD nuclease N-terminal domain-containing protein [Paenibacillus graminis]AIQ71036.1 Negative regulatory protein YxlE [Paenibacillus graminis]MEC0172922.1 PLD nuclease N-terminal domain-containing protein [Paenibacillus graminis]
MDEIKWGLIGPLLALQVLLAVIGLISLSKAERTRGPKWLWVIILIFGNLLGSVAYFTVGRKDN